MRTALHKELNSKKGFKEKLSYLLYAYKFEIVVLLICLGFIIFFGQSILFKSKPILNVGIYTSDTPLASEKGAAAQAKFDTLLKIDKSNKRESVQVMTGSIKKISDEAKMQSLLSAGQLDILVTTNKQFKELNSRHKGFETLPTKFSKHYHHQDLIFSDKRIVGVKASAVPIFKNTTNSKNDVLCLPSKGTHRTETVKLLNSIK